MSNDEIAELTWVAKHEAAKFIKKKGMDKSNFDDAYRHALLGLIRGCRNCDKSKQGWKNYITTKVRGAIIDGFREESPFTRVQQDAGLCRYDYIDEMIDEYGNSFADEIASSSDVPTWIVDDLCSLLSDDTNKTILRMRIDGHELKDISKEVGLCKSFTCRRFSRIVPIIRSYFNATSR